MPSVSKKQHNLMAAVAHSPSFAKKVGIKQSVGKEFVQADKGKKFSGGGEMKHEDIKMDKKVAKKAIGMHDKQLHGGKKTDLSKLCGGGKVKKMADGGKAKGANIKIAMLKKAMRPGGDRTATDMSAAPAAPAQSQQAAPAPAMPRAMMGMPGMKKGGKTKCMAGGGLAAGHKSADGIATKGKTRGTEVKMAGGGRAKKKYC